MLNVIMSDIIKGNKIMQRSSKQVTPKRNLLPPWFPPPPSPLGPAVPSTIAAFPLCTAIKILCRRYSQLRGSPVDRWRSQPRSHMRSSAASCQNPRGFHYDWHKIVAGVKVGLLGILQLFCLGSHHSSPPHRR